MTNQIIVTSNIEVEYQKIEEELNFLERVRIVNFLRDDFKLEDSKSVVNEAYISEEFTKYIIIGAKKFNQEAQNALLKILEEPPNNIKFTILVPSKSLLLPTIRSRLTLVNHQEKKIYKTLDIKMKKLDISALFQCVKEYESLRSHEAKEFLEELLHHIVFIESISLSTKQLESFDKAFRLIELNAKFQTLLVMILMTFIKR